MVHAAVVVPAQDPAPPPGQGEEFGKASPIALVVIILLALATVVLIRGMSKRIRRLPTTFDQPGEKAEKGAGRAAEDADKEGS
jgi:hypothetical protein